MITNVGLMSLGHFMIASATYVRDGGGWPFIGWIVLGSVAAMVHGHLAIKPTEQSAP